MTAAELQALRRLLFFTVPEAATLVAASDERPAGVSERAWQHWERGERPVPADVAERLRALADWRAAALHHATASIDEAPEDAEVAQMWYATIEDWMTLPDREPTLWRPQQSVVAALAGEFGEQVRLVPFDGPAYAAWLGQRRDSEPLRGAWAAEQP